MPPELSVASVPRAGSMAILRLLRPKHWIKNLFVLAPLIFSGLFTRADARFEALFGTLLFCVAASMVYIINDLADLKIDALHPVKRVERPLASGAVSVITARVMLVVLGSVAARGLRSSACRSLRS